jgi:opacity protein-like surface antigen
MHQSKPAPRPIFVLTLLSSALGACASVTPGPLAAPAQNVGPRDNRIDIVVGQRDLGDDLEPVEEQFAVGLDYSRMFGDGRFAWSVGASYSNDEKTVNNSVPNQTLGPAGGVQFFDITGTLIQVDVGARVFLTSPDARVRPYVGAGLAFVQAETEVNGSSGDDSSFGGLLRGGVDFRLTEALYLGLEARSLLGTDFDINGNNLDADYTQFGAVLGFAF